MIGRGRLAAAARHDEEAAKAASSSTYAAIDREMVIRPRSGRAWLAIAARLVAVVLWAVAIGAFHRPVVATLLIAAGLALFLLTLRPRAAPAPGAFYTAAADRIAPTAEGSGPALAHADAGLVAEPLLHAQGRGSHHRRYVGLPRSHPSARLGAVGHDPDRRPRRWCNAHVRDHSSRRLDARSRSASTQTVARSHRAAPGRMLRAHAPAARGRGAGRPPGRRTRSPGEACLLERPQRGDVLDIGIGDAGARRRPREDDLRRRTRGSTSVPRPRPRSSASPRKRSSPATSSPTPTSVGVLGVVGDEVRLDRCRRRGRRRRSRRGRSGRVRRARAGSGRPFPRGSPRSPHQRRTCSRPSQSWTSGRSLSRSGLNPTSRPGAVPATYCRKLGSSESSRVELRDGRAGGRE